MSDLIGKSLGRYHILEQLGQGGMATVYKAYDTRLEREVAVKVIRTERLTGENIPRALKRFEREAKALAQLVHPNIIPIIDYGEQDGIPYLVMDYIPAGTLKTRLQAGPIPWREAARLLVPVAQALHYAHQKKIIHRDVKPSNILITESGQPMLTDFGIAKILELEETMDLTGASMGVGTPEYMAPEQVTSKHVDHRVDVYALGVVFYEMVTGQKPYTADTPLAVLLKHAKDPLPLPRRVKADLPREVERVLLKALAKDPEDRYQTAKAFAEALERLAETKPVRKVQRASLWVGAVLSIVLVLAIGIVSVRQPQGAERQLEAISLTTETPLANRATPSLETAGAKSSPTTATLGPPKGSNALLVVGVKAKGGAVKRFAVDLDTNRWYQLSADAFCSGFDWSPDGQHYIAALPRDGNANACDIYIFPTDDSEPAQLTDDVADDDMAVFSPDGKFVAFQSNQAGNYDIYVMDVDGNEVRQLTNDPAEDSTPTWSPDGKRLAFMSNRDGDFEIYVINVDGTGLRQMTFNTTEDRFPEWSPNGKWIAYHSNMNGTYDIYALNVEDGSVHQLTNDLADDAGPVFSPDGSKIAFHSNRSGNWDVYVMNADGSNERRITTSSQDEFLAHWIPPQQGNSQILWQVYLTPTPVPPTPTVVVTPTIVATPLGDGLIPVKRVVTNVTFDHPQNTPFRLDGNYEFKNGQLILTDKIVSGDPWADGSSHMSGYHPRLGNGTILLFRTDKNEPPPGNYWGPIYKYGPWGSSRWRAIWFIFDGWQIYEGDVENGDSLYSKRFESDIHVQPGVWYYIFFRLHPSGIVESLVWPKGDPSHVARLVVQMDGQWVRNYFEYAIDLPMGTVEVDDFQEVEMPSDDLVEVP